MQFGCLARCSAVLITFAVVQLPAQTKLPMEPLGLSDNGVPIPLSLTVEGGYQVPPPRPIRTPDPIIPKDGAKGFVLIQCIIGKDGRVHNPVVTRSLSPQNDVNALEAV